MTVTEGKKTFTLGVEHAELLEEVAGRFYSDNQTEAVRVAISRLAARHGLGETTWIIDGYVPDSPSESGACYRCDREFQAGEVLYRPVFRRGAGDEMFSSLPDKELWICGECVS